MDGEGNITLLVEVKKTQKATGNNTVAAFAEKVALFAHLNPDRQVLAAILSLGGFTADAEACCKEQYIGMATEARLLYKQ